MHRIHTNESVAVRALQDGEPEVVGRWLRNTLPAIVPEQLPAPVVRHPLEFVCLPLYRYHEIGLCLHVWPDGDETVTPVTHAHSWDLWSYVVCGTVQNQIMLIRDEPEVEEYGLYTVTSVGRLDEVRATGRLVACTPQKRQDVRSGRIYHLPAGHFHRSGHRGLTATVVLGVEREGNKNLILGPPGGYPRHDVAREACSPDQARFLLERVREVVAATG